jgi:GR25 family glycosyltransferase involved in LPS biosynthesis
MFESPIQTIFQYYLISGVDKDREPRMIKEFEKAKIPSDKVMWIRHPNRDELTYEVVSSVVQHDFLGRLRPGQISCTFKHWLCLDDMVKNNHKYGVIIEDNTTFYGNVPEKLEQYVTQLDTLFPDWDICFDLDWGHPEVPLKEDQVVYPKTNAVTNLVHGGSRCAAFYLINLKCAKKLYSNYLPFNAPPDWWMNHLFRELDIKSFWTFPANVAFYPHESTA